MVLRIIPLRLRPLSRSRRHLVEKGDRFRRRKGCGAGPLPVESGLGGSGRYPSSALIGRRSGFPDCRTPRAAKCFSIGGIRVHRVGRWTKRNRQACPVPESTAGTSQLNPGRQGDPEFHKCRPRRYIRWANNKTTLLCNTTAGSR
jgi:hypothetical protein